MNVFASVKAISVSASDTLVISSKHKQAEN